jgi:hypothetical protein
MPAPHDPRASPPLGWETQIPRYKASRGVQQFFNSHSKHGLPWRPWREDRVVLPDGLTASMRQKISTMETPA